MRKVLLFSACSIMAVLLAACGKEEIETTMDSDVGEFNAVTQDEEDFTEEDLKGEWWVVDFIFTNCTTVCSPMTSNMTKIQAQLEDEGVDNVNFLSFSVDPDNDTPEVLKEYGEEHDADFDSWTFLTGYEFEDIEKISMEDFKSPLQPPPEGDDQVQHGVRFFVIDPEGTVVHSYIGTEIDEVDQLVEDMPVFAEQ
ncbi:MAG TPA: SCO family protein [Pseudogracilibacillus sp.]|nr:SCO family protein [Pseudogracilibacillus sp.]